jgi:alkyl hydroperoxide reductase subunit AhpC
MTNMAQQAANMIDMLPDSEQLFALEFVKRLVAAWDPDYTKVTPTEAAEIQRADEDFARGEYVRDEEIEWK